MTNIINFLYRLNTEYGILLWAENGNLNYKGYRQLVNQEKIFEDIRNNKQAIIDALIDNHIISNNVSLPIIYKQKLEKCRLSFAQERLWFVDQYEQGTSAYNIPLYLKLRPNVDIEALQQSINTIIQRHQVLRTVFEKNEETADYCQQVMEVNLTIHLRSYSTCEKLNQQLIKDSYHIFKLNKEIPIKVWLYRYTAENRNGQDKSGERSFQNVEDTDDYLLINIHHIAFDGWSIDIFFKELNQYYAYYTHQINRVSLPELTIQYKDFALWQRAYLRGEILDIQLTYWKEQLSNFENLIFPIDKVRPKEVSYIGRNLNFNIDSKKTNLLKQLAKQQGVTLYTVLLSIFNILLHKYTNQDDIVIGTPITNRHYPQLENLIGFFVNSLVIRTKINPIHKIEEFIQQSHHSLIQAQIHQDLPFEKLVAEIGLEKDTSRHPIFQIIFGVQSFGATEQEFSLKEKQLDLFYSSYITHQNYTVAKFDLSLFIDDSKEELQCNLNYAVSLFNEDTIERLAKHYQYLVEQVTQYYQDNLLNQRAIKDISTLTQKEYQKIVLDWNQTDKAYPNDQTIHELFEEQVNKFPNYIAIIFEETKLTYQELNERSNQLAHFLRAQYFENTNKELKPDTLIAICLDRSLDMMVAILAVLKAGGAYVPMDPDYPEERIKYIIGDTQASIVLTQESYQVKFNEQIPSTLIIAVDSMDLQKQSLNYSTTNLVTSSGAHNLAYIIYTSGTTGHPKGVMQLHGNVMRLFTATNDWYSFTSNDTWTLFHSYVFDFSVWELWGALLYGGRLVIPTYEQTRDLNLFYELCQREKVTVLNQTPSAFYQFSNIAIHYPKQTKLTHLRYVIFGGEALNLLQLKPWFAYYGYQQPQLVNMYGITETTVHVTYKPIVEADIEKGGSYIGQVIPDLRAYVLDRHLQPLPIGAIGELYIGGAGLARGYLNQPELTAERFISNPFVTEQDQAKGYTKLYKTGDLVRWLPDGNMEYIGRNDFQVKIRGYRIELGEIEYVLSTYPGIRQSVVITKERQTQKGEGSNQKYLVGYYVADHKLEDEEIVHYLSDKLSDYMVPSALIYLEKLPLTINGKLNQRALPEPEFNNLENYIAPRNELEKKLCELWEEVLRLAAGTVGIQDDFFRLGGDSIISIQLVSRLRQRLGLTINVKDIFTYKSIERLYDQVVSKVTLHQSLIALKTEQGRLSGQVGLLPIQEWFFENKFSQPHHWNQSFIIKVPLLDIERLEESVAKLIEHHDAFRLRYQQTKNGLQQYYDACAKTVPIKKLDVSQLAETKIQKILTQWQSEFNLEQGPLYCIGYLYSSSDGSARLFFALHHLIVDSVSWRILTDDLRRIYSGEELGNKGTSYRQWVQTSKVYSITHQAEKQYWQEVLADCSELKSIQTKFTLNETTLTNIEVKISKQITKQLLYKSSQAYHTQINDMLLTALGYALYELTGDRTNHIVLEGHGREEVDSEIDITRTMGWFTTMYPVRLEVSEELDESLKQIKETLRSIPNKGLGYGGLMGYTHYNLPKISFNYLGQFDSESKELWTIASAGVGQTIDPANIDPYFINMNGIVVDGILQFHIASRLSQSNIEKLAHSFERHLEGLIHHASEQTRTYLTVSDIEKIISQSYLEELQQSSELEGVYKANNLQQGFIYHVLNQGEIDEAYRVQIIWEYRSKLEVERLKEAWRYAQKRYPALRLRFAWEEELVQIIDEKGILDWRYIDLSHENEDKQVAKIQLLQEEDRQEVYQLEKGNLFRVYLIKQEEDHYTCIFNNHHSILDGWSVAILLDYLHTTYLKLQVKQKPILAIDHSYSLSQQYLQRHEGEHELFWDQYVSQIEERSDLSGLLLESKRGVRLSEYKHIKEPQKESLVIKDALYSKLKALNHREGVTLNAIVQYAWHKVLAVYGNSTQTVVGTTVSGRNLPIDEIEHSVGLYINTLPLVVNHRGEESILTGIKTIQTDINELNERSNISLAKLQQGGERLFYSLLVYENYPNPVNEDAQVLKVNFLGSVEKLDYPLGVVAYEKDQALIFNLTYAGELFDQTKIKNLIGTFEHILKQIVDSYQEVGSKLTYLTAYEHEKIVKKWNVTEKEYPNDRTIHELFEEQVNKTPNHIAIIFEETKLTYRELNERSNQLAHFLRAQYFEHTNKELKPGTLIAICLDRSLDMIVAVLAILKAGGAYVPMDPGYPEERIKYIIEDTQANIVLTQESYKPKFNKQIPSTLIIAVDSIDLQKQLLNYPIINLVTSNKSHHLAYIIYTSGTTGHPKGVMQLHGNVMRLFTETNDWYSFTSNDTWTLFHSYVFDFSVWELWGALLYGGRLVIPTYEQTRDLNLFYELCQREKVTVLNQTPSAFYQFSDIAIHHPKQIKLTHLRYVIFGGEALNLSQLKSWFAYYGYQQPQLVNMYGITETTVHVTYKPIVEADIEKGGSYIGQVIPDLRAYVLDRHLQPLPIGAIGELYIGGAGLARGYLNQPELTAERFISNPFVTDQDQAKGYTRLYKTGDLVRWLPDGNMEYIGRNDFQVKIRGYRIELGEIEHVLSTYPGIRQSVVIAKERQTQEGEGSNQKYLVAYYVSNIDLDEDELLRHLNQQLPEHMVPSVFVRMEELPLTINRKLDQRALPEPKFNDRENYVAPRNELERKACKIWEEVLGLSTGTIGIYDDFFRLGGDSILAIRVVSKLSKEFKTMIRVKDLFEQKCVLNTVDLISKNQNEESQKETYEPFSLVNLEDYKHIIKKIDFIEDIYPASYLQIGMLLEANLDQYSAYHDIFGYKFKFKYEENKFLSAFKKLVIKHELLRASFVLNNNGWSVVVYKDVEINYKIYSNQDTDDLIIREKTHNFDYNKAGLFRIIINDFGDNGFVFIFSFHHAITDGWSVASLINEFIQFYVYDQPITQLKLRYGEFVKHEMLSLKDEKSIKFWKEYLNDLDLTRVNWKFDTEKTQNGLNKTSFNLNQADVKSVHKLAGRLKISVDSIFLLAYLETLSFFVNNPDVTVGIVINNRMEEEDGDKLFGLFLNTIPFRFHHVENEINKNLLSIFNNKLNLYKYKLLPYGYIKSLFKQDIYDFVFNFVHFHVLDDAVGMMELVGGYERTNIPFVLNISQFRENTFSISMIAHDSYVGENFLKYFELYYKKNLERILKEKNDKSSHLIQEDYQKLIIEWNQTETLYSKDRTIYELFEEQVKKTPDNIAIVFEGKRLTFQELNKKSNQLAHYLKQKYLKTICKELKENTLVALCLNRSPEMIVAILAVLKAGGAYVPLDTGSPMERTKYILEDTKVKIVITQMYFEPQLEICLTSLQSNKNAQLVVIDNELLQKDLKKFSSGNLQKVAKSTDLAYVIYTSGTTGQPRGVLIEHKAVINTISSLYNIYDFSKGNKTAAFTSYVFDVSVAEFFVSLFAGAELHILSEAMKKDILLISNYVKDIGINYLYLPPALLSIFPKIEYKTLQAIIYAGEPCDKETGKYWSNKYHLYNYYGPTETAIYATSKRIVEGDTHLIGSPIPNVQCYILDAYLNPLPVGAVGELHIGGAGLARGYLNRPALTTERFISNPFATKQDQAKGYTKLYKTGDLVRWLPDGNIEYIGRNDFQVKIRGYRIELGEIEHALSTYPGVRQSVVIAKERQTQEGEGSSKKYLVAYYVSDINLDEDELLNHLNQQLPEYMVPSIFVRLQELPLTINGKLDRSALPEPEFNDRLNYVAPRNELEQKLCSIWEEVLGLVSGTIGIKDDFFRSGGDSIISIQLISRLRQRLGLTINVKDIFTYKNIERLYDQIVSKTTHRQASTTLKTEQGRLSGQVRLLPIQEWFFENKFSQPHHWNQSFIIKVPLLDIERLEESVAKLIEHHDAFRLRYQQTKNGLQQYYDTCAKTVPIKKLDVSQLAETKIKKILTQWQSKFNLEQGPLYCIGYLHGSSDGSARLFFALHHLIVDSISWRILTDDLRRIYSGEELGNKGTSYRQWINAVKVYGNTHQAEKKYWETVVCDYKSSDKSNQLVVDKGITYCDWNLGKEQTKKLLRESHHAYHTEINDLLLTALGYALYELTGSRANHIVLEGHGREEIDSEIDITHTMGWFTTMYPVWLEVSEELGESLKQIKETLRNIPNKGLGYGILMGYEQYDLPKISFNYLGQFDSDRKVYNEEFWDIVSEESGITIDTVNRDNNLLDINGLLIDGELKFVITSKLSNLVASAFSKLFKATLEKIIDYTTNKTRTYFTISDIDKIISQSYLDKLQQSRELEEVYKANSLQQGFIYHALNQGEIDEAYRVQIIWEYRSKLEVERLKEAWGYAQKRYPALRLRFAWEEELVQIIDQESELNWHEFDLSNLEDKEEQEKEINKLKRMDRVQSYDLARGSLFRITLIKEREDHYICIFNNHHSILDGWSVAILLSYIHETYLKLAAREKLTLTRDYSYAATQAYLQNHEADNKHYWKEYISQIEERSDLSGLFLESQRGVRLSEYKHIKEPQKESLVIKDALYSKLKALNHREGVTLNAIVQYAWHKILAVYGHSSQTVVGTTVSGRNLPIDEIEHSVGLYINTLPLVVNHRGEESILTGIKTIQADINELNERSNISLAKLQQGGERLFDSLLVYENYPNPIKEDTEILKVNFLGSVEKLDYPLGIVAYEKDQTLSLHLTYAGELFDQTKIKNLVGTFEHVLKQIVDNYHEVGTKLTYITSNEYEKIIKKWNLTKKEYLHNQTIHDLFEGQVERTPNHIAIIFEDKKLTYRELNEQSNQLAHLIRAQYFEHANQKLKPDTLIALYLDRSLEMIIAILAILKAGGAYVPMDPSYPEERIKYIISDTQASIVLTQESYQAKLNEQISSTLVITLDSIDLQKELLNYSTTNVATSSKSHHLAYVIYTSGTTGQPRGVLIEHRAVTNTILSLYNIYDFNKGNKTAAFTSYVFDVSVSEFFIALFRGAELHILSDVMKKNVSLISDYVKDVGINYLYLPPAALSIFPKLEYKTLQAIIYAGEPCDKETGRYWSNKYHLYNYYGPTEATIYATGKRVIDGDTHLIGSPIQNVQCYVLEAHLNPIPIGAVGELYIGGIGLARGYLNQPELTAERFIANPFATEQDQAKGYTRLYKTGDLVRWLPDGNIEYIGRNDFQVKIRGYRIELGEIEHALSTYPGVQQCVVIAKVHKTREGLSSSHQYLVSYYVSDTRLNETKLLSHLSRQLPEYMLPSVLVHLEKLPLTINGKLDRRALPELELNDRENYIAPRNELEQKLCGAWEEVLGLASGTVGVQDDFFRLGGDSILSILLNSKLSKLGLCISIKDIFEHRTIEHLTKLLETPHESPSVQTEQGILVGRFNLLPIQQWFFEQVARGDIKNLQHWNQSFLVKVPKLGLDKLRRIIATLVEQHDILRASYSKDSDGYYVQTYNAHIAVPEVQLLDINKISSQEELSQKLTDWQSHFDIERGPLWQIGYINGYSDSTARLYFAFHHLIMDAVSWRILIEDIKSLYQHESLPIKTSSYRQWGKVVNNYATEHLEEYAYWVGVQHNQQDYEHYIQQETQTTHIELDRKVTEVLLSQANKAYQTEINDLLLTALGYAIQAWNKCSINHITLEGHGREHIKEDIDLSRTVGWFTTAYPVKLELQASLTQSIKYIKESLRIIPNKGLGYGALIGYDPRALPKIIFNYLGQFDNSESLWQVVEEASGRSVALENQETNVINMNGMVISGKLKFSLVTKLAQQETQILADKFKYHLEEIVQHCLEKINKKQVEYTQSDFKEYEPYVVFNASAKSNDIVNTFSDTKFITPLFVFPPGEGGAESYFNNLVPHLNKNHLILFNNFYWFLSKKLGDSAVQHYTYEQLASEYIAIMKRIQPVGPYYLLGWSFGGILAFEVARQLCLSGEKLHKLILIDSYFDQMNVMKQLSQEYGIGVNKEDINYKYCPKEAIFNDELVITLYKTTEVPKLSNDMQKLQGIENRLMQGLLIRKYYVENTEDNHIFKFVKKNIVSLISVNSDHDNCLANSNVIKKIVIEVVSGFIEYDLNLKIDDGLKDMKFSQRQQGEVLYEQ